MRILCLGDVVGRPGRRALQQELGNLRQRQRVDLVIANVENAAGGFGLTLPVAEELRAAGVDCLTSGNHIWDKKEVYEFIDQADWLLRPANYPPGVPGRGSTVLTTPGGIEVGVLNLAGRVFMENLDCPFRAAQAQVEALRAKTPIIVVDFHAEATAEKIALGWFLDGQVSAVVGTHTHVPTADARILPGGTAYITDLGMTGPVQAVLGVKKEPIIQRFLTQLPVRFEVAGSPVEIQGCLVTVERKSGRALAIETVKLEVGS
ncbi:MAG: TIGR00282 family metallophosphoesterase [Bacillota bacterium]|nr:TIGR00282 family metallophosphoesterase [Bacillota bacterium]